LGIIASHRKSSFQLKHERRNYFIKPFHTTSIVRVSIHWLHALRINFVVRGDLNNPKFNLRESFMNRISIAIAEKLGLSIQRIGESIVETGAEGAKEVGKGAKSIAETIKKFLER